MSNASIELRKGMIALGERYFKDKNWHSIATKDFWRWIENHRPNIMNSLTDATHTFHLEAPPSTFRLCIFFAPFTDGEPSKTMTFRLEPHNAAQPVTLVKEE